MKHPNTTILEQGYVLREGLYSFKNYQVAVAFMRYAYENKFTVDFYKHIVNGWEVTFQGHKLNPNYTFHLILK